MIKKTAKPSAKFMGSMIPMAKPKSSDGKLKGFPTKSNKGKKRR